MSMRHRVMLWEHGDFTLTAPPKVLKMRNPRNLLLARAKLGRQLLMTL